MPELPEVESVLRSLRDLTPSLIGKTVRDVRVLRSNMVDGSEEAFIGALTGAIFQEIFRCGKYLFFRFFPCCATSSRWMALHLRMTGRLYLVSDGEAVQRHTRWYLLLDDGLALRFDDPRAFGRVWLVERPEEVTAKLGPDGLAVNRDWFLEALQRHRRQLKPLLLDQAFVAGIGNIYADELLFRAGLHPLRTTESLQAEERERLFDEMRRVLQQAVDAKGANIDGVFEAGAFPVAVYGRQEQPCLRCGTKLRKERLAGRGTHYCPVCQPVSK